MSSLVSLRHAGANDNTTNTSPSIQDHRAADSMQVDGVGSWEGGG